VRKKEIKGYPGYLACENGFIYSKKTKRFLKPHLSKYGYFTVCLCKNNIKKTYRVNRIIAETFLDNPENKPQVNHINGIKTDNTVKNLEWVTASENQKHASANNLYNCRKGANNGNSRFKESEIVKIRQMYSSNLTQKEIAKIFKTTQSTISGIVRGHVWGHL